MDDDKPTELTIDDIEKFIKKLEDDDFHKKLRQCFKCEKEFYPNFDDMLCDECYFNQFPKDYVWAFYKSFL